MLFSLPAQLAVIETTDPFAQTHQRTTSKLRPRQRHCAREKRHESLRCGRDCATGYALVAAMESEDAAEIQGGRSDRSASQAHFASVAGKSGSTKRTQAMRSGEESQSNSYARPEAAPTSLSCAQSSGSEGRRDRWSCNSGCANGMHQQTPEPQSVEWPTTRWRSSVSSWSSSYLHSLANKKRTLESMH